MGTTFSQLDWVGLTTIIIGHFYALTLEGQWTSAASRINYEKWRYAIQTWFAPPGWVFQPLWMMLWAFQTAAIFIYWREHHDDTSEARFAAIMSLHIASVFFAKLWTPVFLWGKRFFWAATLLAFLVLATATTVWGLIGYEHRWLPFGLYAPYPILMLGLPVFSGIFYWFGELINPGKLASRVRKGLVGFGKGISERGMMSAPGTYRNPEGYYSYRGQM